MICTTYDLPLALYGDRLGVFVRNDPHRTLAEDLRGTSARRIRGSLAAAGSSRISARVR